MMINLGTGHAAEDFRADVVYLSGKPKMIRNGEVIDVTTKMGVINGDIIRTDLDDLVIIKSKASTYKVSPKSMIKFSFENPFIINSNIAWGTVVINFSKEMIEKSKGRNKELKFQTKNNSFGVRGTKLFTHVNQKGEVTTSVEHGHVVRLKEHNLAELHIHDGQSVMLNKNRENQKAKKIGFEKDINWNIANTSENLNHPSRLFKAIQFKWDSYKKENAKKWNSYTKDMQTKWNN